MAESSPISGDDLIVACAQRINQRRQNVLNIAEHQRNIDAYTAANAGFDVEIAAMETAITAGQPYTPPAP